MDILECGHVVEVWNKGMKPYPAQGHVGEVQSVTEAGFRITHIDWLTGLFSNFDRLILWDNMADAMVATDCHDKSFFVRMIVDRVKHHDKRQRGNK